MSHNMQNYTNLSLNGRKRIANFILDIFSITLKIYFPDALHPLRRDVKDYFGLNLNLYKLFLDQMQHALPVREDR